MRYILEAYSKEKQLFGVGMIKKGVYQSDKNAIRFMGSKARKLLSNRSVSSVRLYKYTQLYDRSTYRLVNIFCR